MLSHIFQILAFMPVQISKCMSKIVKSWQDKQRDPCQLHRYRSLFSCQFFWELLLFFHSRCLQPHRLVCISEWKFAVWILMLIVLFNCGFLNDLIWIAPLYWLEYFLFQAKSKLAIVFVYLSLIKCRLSCSTCIVFISVCLWGVVGPKIFNFVLKMG